MCKIENWTLSACLKGNKSLEHPIYLKKTESGVDKPRIVLLDLLEGDSVVQPDKRACVCGYICA